MSGYNYDVADTELYKTNLYSGPDADLDNTAPVDDTDGYCANIDLTSKIYAMLDLKFDASGATDDLIIKLFHRRDSSWDGDEISILEITVPSDGSEDIFSLEIGPHLGMGPGHYRLSMQAEGATDTFDIDVEVRYSDFA